MPGKNSHQHIDTPAVLIDLDRMEANIRALQKAADEAKLKFRPHTKVHESAEVAKLLVDGGACGIEVGAIGQAEPMADGGILDILISHPFYGETKWEMLERLLRRPNLKISACVDMFEQAAGMSKVAEKLGCRMPLLIKLDVGVGRFGVLPGQPALELAKRIKPLKGVEVAGLYTHEGSQMANILEIEAQVCGTARLLKKNGFKMAHVAVGSSVTNFHVCRLIKAGKFPEITEMHPGNRVFGDIRYGLNGGNTDEEIAISVLVTVMSTSHDGFAIVDAGFKTFGSDIMYVHRNKPEFWWHDLPGFGAVKGYPDLRLAKVAAETGWIYYTGKRKNYLRVGDRLEIVPNNATLVVNLHDRLHGIRNGRLERIIPVTGRGKGT